MSSRRWVFTLNNWTQQEYDHIATTARDDDMFSYLIAGKEVGENGTPHLQGYFYLSSPRRLSYLRQTLSARAHFERARGTHEQAASYCKKEGDFDEFGSFPTSHQGRRSDWQAFREYILNEPSRPTDAMLFERFPGLFARYRDRIHEFVGLIRGPMELEVGEPRPGWQQDLWGVLREEPDRRQIHFVVDPCRS